MEIKCIITDDEPLARKGLREYIEKTGFLSLVGECETAMELSTLLKTTSADVIFLDVEMPGLSGIEFLKAGVKLPKVIIVSAYEQYALKGYELDVFDYLLKPVSYERFFKSVDKLYAHLEEKQNSGSLEHIFVKVDKKIKKILLQDIVYIESMENYVLIHTNDSKEMVYCTLKILAENLPVEKFIQTHRSFIVNSDCIKSIEGNRVEVGSNAIPISRDLKEYVYNRLMGRNFIARSKKD